MVGAYYFITLHNIILAEEFGQNCLHYAVRNNHVEFVEAFAKNEGNNLINHPTKGENETPLFYALKFIK